MNGAMTRVCGHLTWVLFGAGLMSSSWACGGSAGAPGGDFRVGTIDTQDAGPGSSDNASLAPTGDSAASATPQEAGAPPATSLSEDAAVPGAADSPSAPLCGMTPCDPKTSTCCLPVDGGPSAAVCKAGTTATCPSGSAAFHCQQASDCSGGELCCGVYSLVSATAQTQCQASPCQIAQLCKTDAECNNHQRCTLQTCQGQAVLQLCGIQAALGCAAR